MLKAIKTIESYIQKTTFEQFQHDNMRLDACIRQLGIIGEAANRVSEELKQTSSQVPWRQIIGLRNVLIHEYFGVDDKSIWDIITVNLPVLKGGLEHVLSEIGS
jgi:uncharacterized protein with HEPN domain